MKYVNINTGESISLATYNQLNPSGQANFRLDTSTPQPTHQIIEHRSDSMSVGDAVGLVVATPFIILNELFG